MKPSTGHNQSIKRRRARLDWPSGVSNVCRDRTEIRVLMTFLLLEALHGAELLDFRAPQEFIKTNKKFSALRCLRATLFSPRLPRKNRNGAGHSSALGLDVYLILLSVEISNLKRQTRVRSGLKRKTFFCSFITGSKSFIKANSELAGENYDGDRAHKREVSPLTLSPWPGAGPSLENCESSSSSARNQ